MKIVFRCAGWILFAFITGLLFFEYSGISMYDTCLFSLGGQSVGLQGADVFDLSPIIMAVIYFILLAASVVSIFFNKDYIVLTITNSVFASIIFLVLHSYALFYPPFGRSEAFVGAIATFLLFVYLAFIVLVIFVVWNIILHFYRRNESTLIEKAQLPV